MDFRMRRFKRRTSIEVKPQQTMQPKAKQKQRRPSWRPRWEFSSFQPTALREKPKKRSRKKKKPGGGFWLAKKGNTAKVLFSFQGYFGLLSSSSSTHTSADKRRGRALGKAPLPTKCNHWMSKTVSLFEVLIISTRKSEQNVKEMCLRVKFSLSFLVRHIFLAGSMTHSLSLVPCSAEPSHALETRSRSKSLEAMITEIGHITHNFGFGTEIVELFLDI